MTAHIGAHTHARTHTDTHGETDTDTDTQTHTEPPSVTRTQKTKEAYACVCLTGAAGSDKVLCFQVSIYQ